MLVVPIFYLSSRYSDVIYSPTAVGLGKDLFHYYLQFSEKVGEEGRHKSSEAD